MKDRLRWQNKDSGIKVVELKQQNKDSKRKIAEQRYIRTKIVE